LVRTLVACGAAGGISATFNAPIGGVFFAMEIILGRFITPKFGFVVISSVVADVISRVFWGDRASFEIVPYSLVSFWELLPYVLLGIVSALAAFIFVRLLYKCEDMFDAWHIPEFVKPMIGGIAVGAIGLYSLDLLGVGYGEVPWVSLNGIDQALVGNITLPTLAVMLVLKIVVTSITLGSGGSGGIFAPSLFIGAMLGGVVGSVAHSLFPSYVAASGAYALVGMASVFAGATRAPITAIIMLFEMTMDYRIILPLMIAVVISTLVSRRLSRETIYTEKLVRRGINITQLEQTSPLRNVTVGEAMTSDFPRVSPAMLVDEVVKEMRRTDHHGFPVVDETGDFVGMITLAGIEQAMVEGDVSQRTVRDIMRKPSRVAYPDEYVHDVFLKWGTHELLRVPVVSRDSNRHLLGIMSRHDIVAAYTRAMRHTDSG
jgi:CIC family chloride channel protein